MIMARIFAAVLVFLMLQSAQARDTRPDFSGVWEMGTWITDIWEKNEPPFTAAGLAAQQAWEANPDNDPTHQCLFHLVRITSGPFLHQVIRLEEQIIILYEYDHQIRFVHMDGRDHPEDLYSSLMGHSIGWWEGDTLVIETTGVAEGYLRPQGYPHTENLRVIERHRLVGDGSKKEIEMTIIDPEYYSKPWVFTLPYSRVDADFDNYDCHIRPYLPPDPD